MKIQVVRSNGVAETLTLTEPVVIRRGNGFNVLTTSTGMDHFFTQDGLYDGWGMPMNSVIDEYIPTFILEIEKGREFPEEIR